MKRFLVFLGIFALMVFFQSGELQAGNSRKFTVVIDSGHGGRDPGAVGRNSMEKDNALSISLKVGDLINHFLPEVNVVYTRTTDVFVGLRDRAKIANQNNADLFISIHCNGAGNRSAHGIETFVMGVDKNEDNLALAMKENSSIYYEDNYEEIYEGFDPNLPETHIIFSLFQDKFIKQSLTLASLIQNQLIEDTRRVDRGVKQGPFWVLHQTTMPSVLLEVGFITNQEEEKYLMSTQGQNAIAAAIFSAFRDYKTSQDKFASIDVPIESIVKNEMPVPYPAKKAQLEQPANDTETILVQAAQSPTPENPIQEDVSEIVENEIPDEAFAETKPVYPIEEPTRKGPEVVFKVQFLSSERLLPPNSSFFKGLKNVDNYIHMGLYRYTVGNEDSLDLATNLQRNVRNKGFRDAFIVGFVDEKRVTIDEALKAQGN